MIDQEAQTMLDGLRPPKRRRPLIAIIGAANTGTETTDYLMPYGILKRADVAEVVALSTSPGPMRLDPALSVQPQAAVADFDLAHPEGADFIIVPDMSRDDDPAVLRWIQAQAAKGATVIAICSGARIVANAGLLDGRRATTHWYHLKGLLRRHPAIRYVANRRFVVDRGVATTTGVTASMPMSLTLIEAIAGRDRATAVARDLGLAHWDARHDSQRFRFSWQFASTAALNRAVFWSHEELGLQLRPGADEVSLALVANAWSRTYRSRAVSFTSDGRSIKTKDGIDIIPDRSADNWPAATLLPESGNNPPAIELDQALQGIAKRYGPRTADFVAMQLEYVRPPIV
jgi:transcriptional regulator GlxA family with amidase domain